MLKLNGTINGNGTKIEHLSYYKEVFHNDSSFTVWELEAADLPLIYAHHLGSVSYSIKGTDLVTHISQLKYREVYTDYLGLRDWNLETVNHQAGSSLGVTLRKP
ncbi:MAG: hypothetical protein KBA26_00670 [Candidatus Delongbacteria bacterium]|nr:hypothetical protein [Candidatus Delongbacteria bacterium]